MPVFTETTFQELSQQNILGMVEALLSHVVETGCRSGKFSYVLPSFQSLAHLFCHLSSFEWGEMEVAKTGVSLSMTISFEKCLFGAAM